MLKLKFKLSLFNLLSKIVFTGMFLLLMPYIIERINLKYVDNDLVQKREQVLSLISDIGIEPFITSDSSFGSFNILKEEFISIERISLEEDLNFIEESSRLIDDEEIEYRVLNYSFKIDDQPYLLEVGKSLESISATGKNIRSVMLVFLAFIIIITFVTDTQYTRILLTPLERIKDKLKMISDPSLFDNAPVKTNTSDFHKLDCALCEVMENLGTLFQKEKEITVNISHELMTPISVLRSKLENLLLKEDLNYDTSAKLEDSLKTLHRLQSLVNSLLMIARIESNQYLREDSFQLRELLKDIILELDPIAEDADIMIRNDLKDDILMKEANRSLVFSMFYNVANNALKNTPTGGNVLISTSLNQEKFIVAISDTGRGLTEVQKETLFSRFKTRDKNSGEGTGIGLAIAKTIADFHKIKISVASELEKGTTFSFTFSGNS
ncbi:MAG: HAMP domain-containing histidine kinase [Bacteroidales bacterium]|nr:HAMP domain-containing histidine kinase [Bacteroidales bacterium]